MFKYLHLLTNKLKKDKSLDWVAFHFLNAPIWNKKQDPFLNPVVLYTENSINCCCSKSHQFYQIKLLSKLLQVEHQS